MPLGRFSRHRSPDAGNTLPRRTCQNIAMKSIFLSCLIFLLFPLAVDAQRKPLRINLPSQNKEVRSKGRVKGKNQVIYLVNVSKGETLVARLDLEAQSYAAMQVRDPNGKLLTSDDGTDAGLRWSGVADRSGDYRIIVFGPDTANPGEIARYSLSVQRN
jgi:hypothetical protein